MQREFNRQNSKHNGSVLKEPLGDVTWEQATESELMDQIKWFSRANLKQAMDTTEVLPLGVALEDIKIGEVNVKPGRSIKFLGVTVQSNGKFDGMLHKKCAKIRKLA